MRFAVVLLLARVVLGQASNTCPQLPPGASVRPPAELRSSNGKLHVDFSLRTSIDVYGLHLYCYVYQEKVFNPTLRVHPGDEVILNLKNELPPEAAGVHEHPGSAQSCAAGPMTASSTNVHFHGLSIPPACHQDDVLHTLIRAGSAPFEYRFKIPADQPTGLYWYHPHPHGFSERQVLGGASGALIVEGVERAAPEVAGLPERVLVLRDQIIRMMGAATDDDGDGTSRPSRDLSINYVPVMFPLFKPAVMLVRPQQKEFWRVLNASADTNLDLQLLYWPNADTQVAQPLQVIAIDGVPVSPEYSAVKRTSIPLPPGARVEFIVTTPPDGMYAAQLLTRAHDNGPLGDNATYRVLANLRAFADSPMPPKMPSPGPASTPGFADLFQVKPARERLLYFSEKSPDPAHPKQNVSYFLTAGDATPKVFDMNADTPDLTATQGTVEDWVIENRSTESHVFHIHQVHFQLLERDHVSVRESALRDIVEVPFWDGKSKTYPSVKVRMDFRDPDIVGTFMFHCHILEHEDGGMMAVIQILPRGLTTLP